MRFLANATFPGPKSRIRQEPSELKFCSGILKQKLMPSLSMGPKIFLDHPKSFDRVPVVLDRSNLFWPSPNHFGHVQILKISPEKSNLNLTKMIWT